MGFTFRDIVGEIYELPYEANADCIELKTTNINDDITAYHVIMDGKTINVSKETYLAVEIYKDALS